MTTFAGYVYLIQNEKTGKVKVGHSCDPVARRASLQTGNDCLLVLLATREGTKDDEARLHARLSEWRRRGEWFDLPPDVLDALREEFESAGGAFVSPLPPPLSAFSGDLREGLECAGAGCPFCSGKHYSNDRAVTAKHVQILVTLIAVNERWRDFQDSRKPILFGDDPNDPRWIHRNSLLIAQEVTGEGDGFRLLAELRHWGLVESHGGGYWQITEVGCDFALGRCGVPSTAQIFDGELLTLSGAWRWATEPKLATWGAKGRPARCRDVRSMFLALGFDEETVDHLLSMAQEPDKQYLWDGWAREPVGYARLAAA